MKNNGVKRGFSLAAAIVALCLGVIDFIWCLVDIIEMVSLIGTIILEITWPLIVYILLDIAVIIISANSFKTFRVNEDGTLNQRFGLRLTLAIIVGIITLLFFVLGGLSILGVFWLICLGLIITAMCLPTVQPNDENAQVSSAAHTRKPVAGASVGETSFIGKVRELKRMKDLFVITEEQFASAFNKLIEEFKEEILKGMAKDEI